MTGYLLFVLLASGTYGSVYFAGDCPQSGADLLPHDDCTKFTACSNGQLIAMNCAPGTYFNPRIGVCDFPKNVPECVEGTRPQESSITPTPLTTFEPSSATRPITTSQTAPPHEPTSTEFTSTTKAPGISNCGDTLTANAGIIRYKHNETYATNEVCAFVIRTLNHGGFVFNLLSHGINENDDRNAINVFTYGKDGQIDATHLGPPNPLTTAYVSGAIAVIVFRTKKNNGTGFELSFQGIGRTANENGVQMVLSDLNGGNMTIPFWESFSGTTNVLVFTAAHKLADVDSPFHQIRLTFSDDQLYNLGNLINCGFDSLRTYSFVSDVTQLEGLFCDERYNKSIYFTNGILIVIFRKFYDGAWGKVTLTWKVQPWTKF